MPKTLPTTATAPVPVSQQREARSLIPQFGRRLKKWRMEQGLALKQVAATMDVPKTTLSAWENGDRFPSQANLIKLARLLARPLCTLFCTEDQHCKEADPKRKKPGGRTP